MGRRRLDDDNCDRVIKKPRGEFFPHGGNRRSEEVWNDHEDPSNRRRHHGTDPLKDGYDPGENEDPTREENKEDIQNDIPI